jgi:hypothetical protein
MLRVVDPRRQHHEVAPWFLGDVPAGDWRTCDALTQNMDWRVEEARPCSRNAHVMYGELALCWQHEDAIIRHHHAGERTVPVGMAETSFQYGAIETLQVWLAAKRVRDEREREAEARTAAEDDEREAEVETRRAAERAVGRSRRRGGPRPNHLRSVE